MKKLSYSALFVSIILIFVSCATTESVAQNQAEAEESISKAEENMADNIAQTLNEAANAQSNAGFSSVEDENPSSPAEDETSNQNELVSEEDSNFDKDRDKAPTTDEKNKVSEYQIFEDPDILVHDLPEEQTVSDSEPDEFVEEAEKIPSSESTATPSDSLTETKEHEEDAAIKVSPEVAKFPEISESQEINKSPEIQDSSTNQIEIPDSVQPSPIQNEESEQDKEQEEEIPPIIPSRSVQVCLNQYLDIVYPGSGWVYIGETEKTPLFNYFGRKLGTKNTTFALRAKKSGNTILHFYKNDALTGEYIDDYLEVEVLSKKNTGRVKAPAYADIVPAKPQRRIERANNNLLQSQSSENSPPASQSVSGQDTPIQTLADNTEKTETSAEFSLDENPAKAAVTAQNDSQKAENDIKTVIQTKDEQPAGEKNENQKGQEMDFTPISSESESGYDGIQAEPTVIQEEESIEFEENLLDKAKKDFEDKLYDKALNEAQVYYNNASERLDEALYLLGQIWESDSAVKNIRSSVDSYDSLLRNYPKSPLWKEAKNRSIYLKRFYIDIR
ncbi:MAG: hypothetical protein IJ257_01635 [Treponema sp.]|nr:hypothetical protein [Treponema sp.]